MNIQVNISLCRVCMKAENGSKSMLENAQLQKQFEFVTHLQIREGDSLPALICEKCILLLNLAHKFVQTAHETERNLKTLLEKINTNFEMVTKKAAELSGNTNDDEVDEILEIIGPTEESLLKSSEETCATNEQVEIIDDKNCQEEQRETTSSPESKLPLKMLDIDDILASDEDVVNINEPIDEALLEDGSASMNIIVYEDEDSSNLNQDGVDSNLYDTRAETLFVPEWNALFQEQEAVEGVEAQAKKSAVKDNSIICKEVLLNDILAEPEKPFYCIKCKRDFSTKTNLTRHLAQHDGKRPFQCEICSKRFSQSGTLKQHMLIHTGEKPHVCPVCKRGFTQSKSLVFHMRRHSGDKPHTCDYCCALFRQKDSLKAHILKHHMDTNKRVFSCEICNKEIPAQALSTHMKTHLNNHKTALNAPDVMQSLDETELSNEAMPTNNELALNVNGSAHVIDLMATSTTVASRAKKFQCRKCFKCFAIKKNLIRHLSFHDVEANT